MSGDEKMMCFFEGGFDIMFFFVFFLLVSMAWSFSVLVRSKEYNILGTAAQYSIADEFLRVSGRFV